MSGPPPAGAGSPALSAILTDLATRRGDHPALVGATRTVPFRGLEANADRVAHALLALGVGEHGRVATSTRPQQPRVLRGVAVFGAPYGADADRHIG